MFGDFEILDAAISDARTGARYRAQGHVAVRAASGAAGAGDLIDISCSGAAFRFYGHLQPGDDVEIEIKGFGTFKGLVARRIGPGKLAVKFQQSFSDESKLRKRLEAMDAARSACKPGRPGAV
ncbi:MAG: PilZ domain-containing protein [Pseudomonadota bacterium]